MTLREYIATLTVAGIIFIPLTIAIWLDMRSISDGISDGFTTILCSIPDFFALLVILYSLWNIIVLV